MVEAESGTTYPDGIEGWPVDTTEAFKILEQCKNCGQYKTWGFTVINSKTGKNVPGHVTKEGFKIGEGDCPFYNKPNGEQSKPASTKQLPPNAPNSFDAILPPKAKAVDLLAGIKPAAKPAPVTPSMDYYTIIGIIAKALNTSEDDVRAAVKSLATKDDIKMLQAAIKYAASKNIATTAATPLAVTPPSVSVAPTAPVVDATAMHVSMNESDLVQFILDRIQERMDADKKAEIVSIKTELAAIEKLLSKPISFPAPVIDALSSMKTAMDDITARVIKIEAMLEAKPATPKRVSRAKPKPEANTGVESEAESTGTGENEATTEIKEA